MYGGTGPAERLGKFLLSTGGKEKSWGLRLFSRVVGERKRLRHEDGFAFNGRRWGTQFAARLRIRLSGGQLLAREVSGQRLCNSLEGQA